MGKLFSIISMSVLGLTLTLSVQAASKPAEQVYLFAGQSNMAGQGLSKQLPRAYRQHPRNVVFYYQGRRHTLGSNTFFGPEIGFAHKIARAYPNKKHIIIKQAAGGSSIQQWLPGQQLYQALVRQPTWVHEKRLVKVDAVFWMQGERDARTKKQASQYELRLKYFIQSIRKKLGIPNSWFIMGEVNPQTPIFKKTSTIRQAQRKVMHDMPHAVLVSTKGLGKNQDKIHYNTYGQLELGKRFAQTFIKYDRQRRVRLLKKTKPH